MNQPLSPSSSFFQPLDDDENGISIGISIASLGESACETLIWVDGERRLSTNIPMSESSRVTTLTIVLSTLLSQKYDSEVIGELAARTNELFTEELPAFRIRNTSKKLSSYTSESAFVLNKTRLSDHDRPRDYLIERILADGEPCILGGPEKSLKSTIAIDLLLSLETGLPFLGEFRVPEPRGVMMISSETTKKTTVDIIRRVAASKGCDESQIKSIFDRESIFFDRPDLSSKSVLKTIGEELQNQDYGVLILDSAYQMLPAEGASSLFAFSKILCSINDVCRDNGTTLVLVHHARKTDRLTQVPDLEHLLWSGFKQWARQWVLLSHRKNYIAGTGSHEMFLNASSSIGHQGTWKLDVEEGAEIDAWGVSVMPRDLGLGVQDSPDQGALLDGLKDSPDGLTSSVFKKRLGFSNDRFKLVVGPLLQCGKVIAVESKRNGQKCTLYSLPLNH